MDEYIYFNSHAHVERDSPLCDCLSLNLHFNSHAHVERDVVNELKVTIVYISTHTLTWSVTMKPKSMYGDINISTHTLTWSVTRKPKSPR